MAQGYCLGIAVAFVLISFWQDYLGLESYIRYAREHWREFPLWRWSVALFVLLFIGGEMYSKAKRDDKKP